MNPLKRLAGQTVLYGLGSMLPRMLNFLLVPLHTVSMFSKEEYGVVTQLMAIVAVVNVVFMFGMETSFFRFSTKENADHKKIFNIAQTVVLLISFPLTVLFIVFASPIAALLSISNHPEFIVYLSLVMFVDAWVAIPFAQLRLQNKALKFATLKIINVLILLALNYYFLKVVYDPGVNVGYVFIANLIANAVFILFFLKELFTWRPTFDRELTPVMVRYAYPVMITGVAGMINEMFSRFTLEWWLPDNFYPSLTKKEAGGVFGACYKFAVFMNLGIQAFRYAAEPFFFSSAQDKNSPQLFARVNHYFIITCCVVLLGISINLDILKYFIGKEFWPGLSIVPILLLAYLFLGVYYNVSVWFKLTDKTYYGTLITVGGAIVTLLANFILIPYFGFMGSAWAALACYAGMALVCYRIGQKFYPIPYAVGKAAVYILVTMLVIAGVNAVPVHNQWLATGFHTGVIALFLTVVYFAERQNFRKPGI